MSVTFACPGCGKSIKVRDELAGKKGKCPGCGAILTVPEDEAPQDNTVIDVSALQQGQEWHVA